jgi:hypothetical protein
MMFSVFCPTHNKRILMTRRNAISFWNTDNGPVIRWKCSCGHEGVLGRAGCIADATHPDQAHTLELGLTA